MTPHVTPALVVDRVTEALVATQRFPTKEDALWDLAMAAVKKKFGIIRDAFDALSKSTIQILKTLRINSRTGQHHLKRMIG